MFHINGVFAAEGIGFWPILAAGLALSAAWDCYSGSTRFGRYLEFDKDDNAGSFIILVGLKFVAALLVVITIFAG